VPSTEKKKKKKKKGRGASRLLPLPFYLFPRSARSSVSPLMNIPTNPRLFLFVRLYTTPTIFD
jgi:hypothetical protein